MNSEISNKDIRELTVSLKDTWEKSLKEESSFETLQCLSNKIQNMTKEYIVQSNEIFFGYFDHYEEDGAGQKLAVFYRIGRDNVSFLERTGSLFGVNEGEPGKFCKIIVRNGNAELMKENAEGNGIHVFLSNSETPNHAFLSQTALQQFYEKVGAKGEGSWKKPSLPGTVHLAKALLDGNCVPLKLVIRTESSSDGSELNKVVAVLTEKHESVELNVLTDVVENIMKDTENGRAEVSEIYASHNTLFARVDFPDLEEDYALAYNLPEKGIPGVIVSTSQTGLGAVNVQPTFRIGSSVVIMPDEGLKQVHRGKEATAEAIHSGVRANVYPKLRAFPEDLVERMGHRIGTVTDFSSSSERQKNVREVYSAIRAGMKELGLYPILGKKRKAVVLNALKMKLDPRKIYTEYDIATMLMSLQENLSLDNHSILLQIQKKLGKAASIPYSTLKDEEEEVSFVI